MSTLHEAVEFPRCETFMLNQENQGKPGPVGHPHPSPTCGLAGQGAFVLQLWGADQCNHCITQMKGAGQHDHCVAEMRGGYFGCPLCC